MPDGVAVLVPWRGGCPHRERAWSFIRPRYEWPVFVGELSEGPWIKAHAVARALAQTDAEVLVLADADCVTDGLPEAVAQVEAGAAWAVPHKSVHRLSEEGTARYMAGEPWEGLPVAQRPYSGMLGGGFVVLRREVYEATGFDPRFVGWGGEDECLASALLALVGAPWRGRGHLLHLWHPPPARLSRRWGSLESRELVRRYQRARRDPRAMRSLLDEPKSASQPRVRPAPAIAGG